jgi:3-isopropylmalate/(R)-2-methylmalate dehydratase small subunit
MTRLRVLRSRAIPLDIARVDTDRIIPARFLKQPRGPGYRDFLFHDDRFDPAGRPLPGFVLDDPVWRGARILVADADFGLGSAREGAVWALQEFGFAVVIASSFGDVFRANCVKNGLLPIVLPHDAVLAIRDLVRAAPATAFEVGLPDQRVSAPDGASWQFDIDPFDKQMLLDGRDLMTLTLDHLPAIETFESSYRVIPIAEPPR